ncbi:MAG: alpha/beta fold hydrolase [Ruminococcaceae bacterium]|nr:alpha/beta fold hydrolase [Oscillospiraceae bacterium]
MLNRETVRIVSDAKTAVLMIHGICGTPNHFRALLPLEEAVPADWSLYNIVLDGHCEDVPAFGKASMKKWKAQTEKLFEELCNTYENIVLVGHSMGTLLSVRQALRRPEKVRLLFMVAAPTPPFVRLSAASYAVGLAFGIKKEKAPVYNAMGIACGMKLTPKLWRYIPWIPRMIELLQECSVVSKLYKDLQVPCIAWQSEKDELVSRRSIKVLQKCGTVQVNVLPNSTHFYYKEGEREQVVQSFREACKAI